MVKFITFYRFLRIESWFPWPSNGMVLALPLPRVKIQGLGLLLCKLGYLTKI